MSKENDAPEIAKSNTPAPLTVEALAKMVLDLQKDNAAQTKAMAEAIIASRIPYVDPNVLEEKKRANEQRAEEVRRTLLQKTETKRQCPHVRTNSDNSFDYTRLNIKWMEHSNGIILGVCGTCFSEFDARNPKDLEFLRRDGKAMKNMGRARENSRLM